MNVLKIDLSPSTMKAGPAAKPIDPSPKNRTPKTKIATFVLNLAAVAAILLVASATLSGSSTGTAAAVTSGVGTQGEPCTNGGCRRGALATSDSAVTGLNVPRSPGASKRTGLVESVPFKPAETEEEIEALENDLTELGRCQDFACVSRMHTRLQGRTRFNFPHFFLAGWQKCATTSVNAYLRHHPQYLPGLLKESHYFSQCMANATSRNCHATSEGQYMQEYLQLEEAVASGLDQVTFDASVDYARKGEPLAKQLYELFPWVKIVVIMREPISRVISYSRMYTERQHQDKGCFGNSPLYDCLIGFFDEANPRTAHYDDAMEGWLKVFPANQIHAIQFEELQEDPNGVLRDLKTFLGMDPKYPKIVLSNLNNRKKGGYPMRREQYQELVDKSRPKAERLAKMLADAGLADAEAWMQRWRAVWDRQLTEGCNAAGDCEVNSN